MIHNYILNIILAFKTLPKVFLLFYKNDKKYLLFMFLEVAVFSIDKYPALIIMKYTIDALTQNMNYTRYVYLIIPLIVTMLVIKMIRVIINTSRPCRDQVITEKLFNEFFAKCMKINYQTLENKDVQEKKELAKFIANGKIAAIGWYFVEMFSSLIALIIASIFILRINIFVLVIIILGMLGKFLFTEKYSNKTVPIIQQQIIDNKYLSYLFKIGSDYEYAKEFRVFNYKNKLYEKISMQKNVYIKNNNKLLNYDLLQSFFQNIENFITKLFSFSIMGISCLKSIITISEFTFTIGLVNDYITYSNSFISSCKSYLEASSYVEHYFEFMNLKSNTLLTDKKNKISNSKLHIIEFKKVYFKYPNSDNYVLKNINLKITFPTKISLVGKNGAGKSTLIKLLLRLYKPNKGIITLDDINIYEYSNEDYINLFSSVFQDFVLFAFSISDNITCFDKKINRSCFEEITKKTKVTDFVCNYPNGYETYFSNAYSNDGVEFSGGEQQKIALARSLYKKSADFFVLDEPTSAYDVNAEYQLYKTYEELLFDKTTIFISHRLSSCKLSDCIILLDNGMIIEKGSHDELMAKDTQYKRMFELQADQYNWGENTDE